MAQATFVAGAFFNTHDSPAITPTAATMAMKTAAARANRGACVA
jgi:hypothetical protein